MKIGIWFPNKSFQNLDYSKPESNNPGMGGTAFEIALLISLFPAHSKNHDLIQFTEVSSKIESCKNIVTANVYDAIKEASNIAIELFVTVAVNDSALFNTIEKYKMKTVFWGHNYYYSDMCNNIVKSELIVANVFCGKQVYDRYIDHEIIKKSTFIFNMLGDAKKKRKFENIKNHNITYIGAIIPSKGFHVLAKQWPKILKRIPDAKLNVIGTGNLYGENSNLGELGLANKEYEKTFIEYITDSNGELLESIVLHGIVAQAKKKELINNSSLGVINPTGITENCPVSAIDFQSHGVPVVTKYKNGSVDILINNKTGIFFLLEKNLHKKIIKLISDKKKNEAYGKNAIEFFNDRFATKKILPLWEKLFNNIELENTLNYINPNNHFFNNLKFIRVLFRFIRFHLKFKVLPSLIYLETMVKYRILEMTNK
jgi:glycosyltransferase involved in cell wall biosynthesis